VRFSVRNTGVFSCALPMKTTPSSLLNMRKCYVIKAFLHRPLRNKTNGMLWSCERVAAALLVDDETSGAGVSCSWRTGSRGWRGLRAAAPARAWRQSKKRR
jgi:hypothetical protein